MTSESTHQHLLWTFDNTSAPSTLDTPTSDNNSKPGLDNFRFSPGATAEFDSLVSLAFDNVERALSSGADILDGSLDNKAIVVSCTQAQGASVIDAAIKQAARKQAADVLVLDAFELARGRFGALGKGAKVLDKLYGPVRDVPKKEIVVKKSGGGSDDEGLPKLFGAFLGAMKEMKDSQEGAPLNEEFIPFFKALLSASSHNSSTEPKRRIIYMRNFNAIAGAAKPLMTYILHSLYGPSGSDNEPSEGSDSGEGSSGCSDTDKDSSECSDTDTDCSKDSDTEKPTSEDRQAPASKRADVIVFGTNDPGSLVINANPSDGGKDTTFLGTLFTQARSSVQASRKASTPKRRMLTKSRLFRKIMDSDSDSSDSDDDAPKAKGNKSDRETIRFDARLGRKTDELAAGALKVSVFAANVKVGADEEEWQKESKAEQIKALNKAVLSACLERAGGHTDEDLDAISSWGEIPSTGLLSVQDATSIVYPALGLKATPVAAGEPSRTFKDCLEASHKVIEQRKKEHADWARGIDPTKPQDADSGPKGCTDTEESKEDVEKLIKGVSSYAKELKECIVDSANIETTFADVFVDPSIVEALQTIVSLPLLFPSYFKLGVLAKEAIGGILLYGPPGTGKTMLCRALAKTSKSRMIHVKPSDINDKCVGESEKKVAAVFELAYKIAPCIVFIDEVDSLFSSRDGSTKTWDRNILTEFMQGMDGLGSAKKNRDSNITIVGATNRPFDLDLAILRRMPRKIFVDMPNLQMRKGILGSYLKHEDVEEGVNIDRLAMETEGFSGSDLKNLCVAAALASVKKAIGPKWREGAMPPTPPKTPTDDAEAKVGEETDSTSGNADGASTQAEGEEKSKAEPARKITSENFRQARVEIVKSNTGSRLDELYRWHRDHSSPTVGGGKTTTNGSGSPGVSGGSGSGSNGFPPGTYGAKYGAGGYGAGSYGSGGYGASGLGAGLGGGDIGVGGGITGLGAGGLSERFGAYGGGYGAGGMGGAGTSGLGAGFGGLDGGLGGLGGSGLGAGLAGRFGAGGAYGAGAYGGAGASGLGSGAGAGMGDADTGAGGLGSGRYGSYGAGGLGAGRFGAGFGAGGIGGGFGAGFAAGNGGACGVGAGKSSASGIADLDLGAGGRIGGNNGAGACDLDADMDFCSPLARMNTPKAY